MAIHTGARVIGPAREPMPEPLRRVSAHDRVEALGLVFEVLEVPGHTAGHVALFAADGYWRDLVSFTWNIRTCEGTDEIAAMLAATTTW